MVDLQPAKAVIGPRSPKRSLSMLKHKLPVMLLALVLVLRGVHCLYVEAELCAAARAAQSESPPLADPSESDPNETGCLCKGALVTVVCPVADLRPQADFAWLRAAAAPLFDAPALPDEFSAPAVLLAPPVSGRTLRALRASWQI
jgi:hypothetical protein